MKFLEAMEFINSRNQAGMVLGLETITNLLIRLGNQEKDLTFIHIAGTNGKGSVGAYITNVLAKAGYRVGRYVSPTIFEYCERIQIQTGHTISYITEQAVGEKTEMIQKAVWAMEEEQLPLPTAFEIETAMAFMEFKEKKCDYVVLEVGLGGIEDATNVIQNVALSVLTSISKDHMHVLGNTIEEITEKKAGIIKPLADVVCYDYREQEEGNSIQKVIDETCQRQKSYCVKTDFGKLMNVEYSLDKTVFTYDGVMYETSLLGENQPKNAALAIEAVECLRRKGLALTKEAVIAGVRETEWKGRFSVVSREPLVIVDGAHNEDAARSLAKSLKLYFGEKKVIFLVGVFKDKEYEKILEITSPYAKKLYAIETEGNKRALPSGELAKVAAKYVEEVVDAKTVENGLSQAMKEDDVIVAFGSLSFLGEVYKFFEWKWEKK